MAPLGSDDRSKVALGRWGEERVARWYVAAGYAVLDRNWYGDGGELDLILGRGPQIIFCEVKTRTSDRFGAPVEAVDFRKQRRIRALAIQWLRHHGRANDVRFDVAAVLGGQVSVVESAF